MRTRLVYPPTTTHIMYLNANNLYGMDKSIVGLRMARQSRDRCSGHHGGRKTRNWRALAEGCFFPHSHRQFINWLYAFCITILLTLGVALLRIRRVGAYFCTLAAIRTRPHASSVLLQPFDFRFVLFVDAFLLFIISVVYNRSRRVVMFAGKQNNLWFVKISVDSCMTMHNYTPVMLFNTVNSCFFKFQSFIKHARKHVQAVRRLSHYK